MTFAVSLLKNANMFLCFLSYVPLVNYEYLKLLKLQLSQYHTKQNQLLPQWYVQE